MTDTEALALADEVIAKYGANADKPSVKLALALKEACRNVDCMLAVNGINAETIAQEARTAESAVVGLEEMRVERDAARAALKALARTVIDRSHWEALKAAKQVRL